MQNSVQVYGQRCKKSGKINIGYKSPNGKDYYNYITSLKNEEFWKDYSKGLVEKTLLFEGTADQDDVAQTLEWFALDYGTKVNKELFYIERNNAHCVDLSLLTPNMKKVVIDYIEGVGNGIDGKKTTSEDVELVERLSQNVKYLTELGDYVTLPIHEVEQFERNQVRSVIVDPHSVREIVTRMEENPTLARQVFKPIVCVVKDNGTKCIVDGNTRFAAAKKAKGWDNVPVIFIHESEFGSNELEKQNNYDLFGLYENKESFEIKKTNSKEDLKRNVVNYLLSFKLDFNKNEDIEKARKLIYERFTSVVATKKQLSGALQSILTDFNKDQAELKYQKNLITYDEAYLTRYTANKYEINGIAAIYTHGAKLKFGEAIGYALRHMRSEKLKKGAIVVYYKSKEEYSDSVMNGWVENLKEVIDYCNLPLELDVLPAFEE